MTAATTVAGTFRFRLYVAGATPNSAQALANLKGLCRRYLPQHHEIDIVDIFKEPERALQDGIMLTPTLVKISPLPVQRFVGTLSQTLLVLQALGLEASADP